MSDPSSIRRFAVAQLGARMHYAVPALLHRAGLLDRLYTDLCADVGWLQMLGRIMPRRLTPGAMKRLLSRHAEGVPAEKIVSFSRFGLGRFMRGRGVTAPAQLLRHYAEENARFCELVLRHGLGQADALYCFNAAGVELMRHGRDRGSWIVLEHIGAPFEYDETLLADERSRWRGWENGATTSADWEPLARREREEWELADAVLCASDYVEECVRAEGWPSHKCQIVPYGVDAARFAVTRDHDHTRRQPLRALCVAMLQLRKGVPYLMQAAHLLTSSKVKIRTVGSSAVSEQALEQMRSVIDVAGVVPRSQIRDEYANADVFVLPTLSEGSATVCYEALAAGLPVITTPNAGSVVRDGVEGFIVPIRDPQAIADRLVQLETDRAMLARMSAAAVQRAQDYTWDQYGQRLLAAAVPKAAAVA
jgi:glycosyltransferase involved in cell wall biosynthesis